MDGGQGRRDLGLGWNRCAAAFGASPNPGDDGEGPQLEYLATGDLTGHSFNGIAKFDQNFTEKDHVSVKAFMGQGNQIAPTTSFLQPYYEEAPIHVYNYSIVYNRVISPSIVNQLFLGVNYYNQVFSDANHSFNPVALGLNTGVTNPSLSGAPRIDISAAGASSGLSATNNGFDPTGPTPDSGRTGGTRAPPQRHPR